MAHCPKLGCPFIFIFVFQPYEGSGRLPPLPPSLLSPTAIGKGSPHHLWVLRATGREALDRNPVGGAPWVLPGPPSELQAPLLYSTATDGAGAGLPTPWVTAPTREGRFGAWGGRGGVHSWATGGPRLLAPGHMALCGEDLARFLSPPEAGATRTRTGSRRSPGTSVSGTPMSQAHVVRAIATSLF